MDKRGRDFWGPSVWVSIHSFAAAYRPDQAVNFRSFMNSLTGLLPCAACREHLRINLVNHPMDNYLGNNHDLFFWTYILHDAVNKQHNLHSGKVKKVSPPFDRIKHLYFRALAEECSECQLK